jgi:pyridinium-3,5-biscarboxylic acid mononucleotide synthase
MGPDRRVADLGDARLDLDRRRRTGMPEAVYGAGKTTDQVVRIVRAFLADTDDPVIVTRTSPQQRAALAGLEPQAVWSDTVTWRHAPARDVAPVALVTGGTSDQWVLDECLGTLSALGVPTTVVRDVGVAGLHRLLDQLPTLGDVSAVVAVAGMEAALPTVLGGLIAAPLIAVPTSVGYGSSLEGVTALLSMLASCAPGIAVVGIDNGYGAACAALRIVGPVR